MNAALVLSALSVRFGGLEAVSDLSLSVAPGSIHGLIGPNGAGKTTVFNAISGFVRPSSGRIEILGVESTSMEPHRIASLGVGRTFQNIRLFPELDVLQNLLVGFHAQVRHRFLSAILRLPSHSAAEREIAENARALLDSAGLGKFAMQAAATLPYGHQRKLEILRCLAARPRLLLLDEPAAGMNATEKLELRDFIRGVRDRFHLSVLIIEHDVKLVMGLCDRIAVMDHGVKICEGSADEVRRDPKVVEAYTGTSDHA